MMRLRPYKPSDADKLLSWWKGVPEELFVMWSNGRFEYPLTMEQMETYFQTWCVDEENGWLMNTLSGEAFPNAAALCERLCQNGALDPRDAEGSRDHGADGILRIRLP